MNRALASIWSVLLCLALSESGVAAQSAQTSLVQPPHLERPEAGSVSGSLGARVLGAGSLARGNDTLPLAAELPTERGACPVAVFPSYSHESGASEWGIGWDVNLRVQRIHLGGHLDYETDDWTSPWGRLVLGNDGAYYPLGLSARVRVRETERGFEAVDADGTRFSFHRAERTAQGVYAYWLTSVVGALGEQTTLSYVMSPSERPFLESVRFGGPGFFEAQRVLFEYEPLASAMESYASGELRLLDRRVARVLVQSRADAGSPYVERYRYVLSHDRGFGPAPRLRSIARSWPDGSEEPATRYDYGDAADTLSTAEVAPVTGASALLERFGTAALDPRRGTWFDVDDDGVLDLEHHQEQTVARNTESGWVIEPLLAESEADPALHFCRPNGGVRNPPRRIAWVAAPVESPQVVVTQALGDATRILVCDRDGAVVRHDAKLDGEWTLGTTTHLVDVDGDRRADLVKVRSGGVQTLLARGDPLTFEPGAASTLAPRMTMSGVSFRDMNGDGIVDLLARTRGALLVWSGTGHGQFQEQPRSYQFFVEGQLIQDLSLFEPSYADIDGDGLSDVVMVRSAAAAVFANDGTRFHQVRVPALANRALITALPMFVDLQFRGEAELTFVRGNELWALPLRSPNAGLLTGIDDGRGARLRFDYERGPTLAGTGGRSRVLARVERVAPARGTWTTRYAYDEPVVDSRAHFLLGYTRVRREETWGVEEAHFAHRDEAPATLVSLYESNVEASGIVRFTELSYDDATAFGVAWRRPTKTVNGYARTDGTAVLSESTEITTYERDICPTGTLTTNAYGSVRETHVLAAPLALRDALHCLPQVESWALRHPESDLDVDMERITERDDRGQVKQVSWRQADGTLLVTEQLRYDALHRLRFRTLASGEQLEARYDARTGRLLSIHGTPGVSTHVDAFDAETLDVERLRTQRDLVALTEGFAYDGWERLERAWNDVSGTSALSPSQRVSYALGTSSTLGQVRTDNLIEAGSERSETTVYDAAGEQVASALRIPEGWAVYDLQTRDAGTRFETRLRAPRALPHTDDEATLFADAISLETARFDAWNNPTLRTSRLQEHSTRSLEGVLSLDADGLVTALTENGSFTTQSTQDAHGRPRSLRDETGATTRFDYDALGRLVLVTLPDATRHARRFDALGRPSRISRDRIGDISYRYDGRTGLLSERQYFDRTGAALRSEHLEYDASGRLESIEAQADGELEHVRLQYDGDGTSGQSGRLTKEQTDGFSREKVYRPDGKVHSITEELSGFRTLITTFTYTPGGQIERITRRVERDAELLETTSQHYRYDAHGRLATLDVDDARIAELHYDASGRPDHIELSGGRAVVPFYDPVAGSLSGASFDAGPWVAETRVELNDRGQVERELFAVGEREAWTHYGYDDRGLLRTETHGAQTYQYAYDAAARPRSADDLAGARQVRTGDANDPIPGLVYDRFGRLVARDGSTFIYGPRGRVQEVRRDGHVTRFVYDAEGLRVLKIDAGVPTEAYVSGGVLTEQGFSEPLRFGGHLLGELRGGQLFLVGSDVRGTPFVHADGRAAQASAFGVRRSDDPRSGVLDYGEQGFDPSLGAVRMGARDYDPALGAFHTPDLALLEQPELCLERPVECNLYGYARGNPTAHVDPEGKWAILIPIAGAILVDMLASGVANAPGADGRVDTSMPPETKVVTALSLTSVGVGLTRFAGRALARARLGDVRAMQSLSRASASTEAASAAAKSVTLDASAIRFSQSNVRSSLPELTQAMKAKGWQGAPIDVVRMPDGTLIAADNTRLAAANLAKTPVQAVLRNFDEAFPAARAGGNLQGATWGEAVLNRIANQKPAWRRLYPNGSPFTGTHPSTPSFSP